VRAPICRGCQHHYSRKASQERPPPLTRAPTNATGCPGIEGGAERYFSAREREALRAVSTDQILQAFFQGWTHKEAYSKALGQGVSRRWRQFSVPLAPGALVELSGAGIGTGDESRFTLCPLEPGAGYVAAVAAQGRDWHLRCWQWTWTGRVLWGDPGGLETES
jgi:hypothetical protein